LCSIQYDCYYAPFELNDVVYSWWNDINGNAKYFWAGADTDVHTCQCGIDGNCVESFMKCNCDSAAPEQLVDSGKFILKRKKWFLISPIQYKNVGIINDKKILPITRLNFGRTQQSYSSGVHTLGRFECTGQVAVTGMPTSCADLWRIGHTLSGLYSVKGVQMVESVYCDFSKLPDEAGINSSLQFLYTQPNFNSIWMTTKVSRNGLDTMTSSQRLPTSTSSGIVHSTRSMSRFRSRFLDWTLEMPWICRQGNLRHPPRERISSLLLDTQGFQHRHLYLV
jgi:hypothetical protein